MHKPILILTAPFALILLVGAGSGKPARSDVANSGTTSKDATSTELRQPTSVGSESALLQRSPAENTVGAAPAPDATTSATGTASAAYQINWSSINAGGAIQASSASYKMGLSVGQSVAGSGSSANYKAGIGFWYGAGGGGGGVVCAITTTGDVNLTGTLTSADIIFLVNFVFKGGATPSPCEAAGDVNCNGTVTSSDIIYLVNHVFKGGAAPCDVCTLIPATWPSCP
jgi:hypothetical protein